MAIEQELVVHALAAETPGRAAGAWRRVAAATKAHSAAALIEMLAGLVE